MQILYHEHNLDYDGSQLHSHFAYRRFGILGDSCVAFAGGCRVDLKRMVDLEDVRKQAPIFSHQMLHFIAESFQLDLKGMVLLQRLWVAILADRLRDLGVSPIRRQGDDLFVGDKKLSVSIATVSPVSSLMHLALNIRSDDTPVPTSGLKDLKIQFRSLAETCLQSFAEEYTASLRASYKVRGVD